MQDIATVNDWLHTLSVLTGNGDGTFQNRTDYDVGYMWSWNMSITSGDFNGDGKTDIAAASYWYSAVLLFINTGDGNFQRWQINDVGLNPISISAGDINGDGKIDIALTNDNQNSVSIVIGNGDGTFQPKREYNVGFNPSAVTLADIDGDGKIDLALTKYNQNTVVILTGNSDGTFELAGEFNSGPLPVSIIAGDFNGDHKIDLAIANWDAGTISVLINNHPPLANAGPDQIIECANPSGASVTLNGSASSDPDGDPIILKWTWPGGSTEGVSPNVTLPMGTTVVTLTVSDGKSTATATVNITVRDTTPPVTTATGGNSGWYNTNVISTFSAYDSCSGVKEIHYIVNGFKTVTPGSYTTATLTADGIYNITYFAVDNAGNAEAPNAMIVKIDKTPPQISINSPESKDYFRTDKIVINFMASDAVSGVSATIATLDGNPVTNGQEINLKTLTLGSHTLTVNAFDQAGNSSTISATFNVVPVPFSSFSAKIEADVDPSTAENELEAKGNFALGGKSDGIDIPVEIVALQLTGSSGGLSFEIAAGSFTKEPGKSEWRLEGIINNLPAEMKIKSIGSNSYAFEFEAQGVNLCWLTDLIRLRLTIGDDFGEIEMTPEVDELKNLEGQCLDFTPLLP